MFVNTEEEHLRIEIGDKVGAGQPWQDLLPPAVALFIEEFDFCKQYQNLVMRFTRFL